ncbi:hypothetical protein AAVH_37721, partial [Aphelenchoides avenae]
VPNCDDNAAHHFLRSRSGARLHIAQLFLWSASDTEARKLRELSLVRQACHSTFLRIFTLPAYALTTAILELIVVLYLVCSALQLTSSLPFTITAWYIAHVRWKQWFFSSVFLLIS